MNLKDNLYSNFSTNKKIRFENIEIIIILMYTFQYIWKLPLGMHSFSLTHED